MHKKCKIGVVILAYNVERFIKNTIEGIPGFVDKIYVVDDSSCDHTAGVIRSIFDSRLLLIQHDRNRGPGAAMLTGYKSALVDRIDIIVKLDGDGQMPLEQIENLINPIIAGEADYTKGDRLSQPNYREGMSKFRLFGNILLTGLTRISSGYWHINDTQNGFVAISKKALRDINTENLYSYYGYLNDILVRLNICDLKVLDVPMAARYGMEKSSIKLRRYIFKVSFLLLNRYIWRLKMKYCHFPQK